PQPASSTVNPLTSPANAQSTGSEFRMRLPSPSSPTCLRQSSATRFQRSRVSSYAPLLIALSPAGVNGGCIQWRPWVMMCCAVHFYGHTPYHGSRPCTWMILRSVSGIIIGGQACWEERQTMDVQEILPQLATNTGTFPREAVAQAIAQRETITPELLRVLVEAQHNLEDLPESDSMAHIYAMYLLAQFREPRAYPLIVEFFSIPGDIALDTTGDVATEDLGRILASVSCGDIRLMTELVENEHANEYVRVAALRGLVTLVARGEQSRDDIVTYLQRLYQGELARDESFVWSGLVSVSNDLYPEELYDDIKHAYDEELIETAFIGLD